jgi:hypothetical protein
MTGDFMAEDPLCTHQPGTFPQALEVAPPSVEYGREEQPGLLEWDPDARERMQRVPAFVRGMVIKAVESHCAKHGISRVTEQQLDEIRSRMPASRIFGRRPAGRDS